MENTDLMIKYELLKQELLNENDSNIKRLYKFKLYGFIDACRCIESEESKKIINDYFLSEL